MPKVSVVIPVYNVEKYLGECLDSVLRQTFKDLEIICVDDGSTDSSPKILADYAAKDSRIKIITQPNGGLSAARNAGMDAASGKYIYFLDSDDYITDDAMERCVEICERDNLDQLVFGCNLRFEDESMPEKMREKKARCYILPDVPDGKVFFGPELMREIIRQRRRCVSACLRLYRLEWLREVNLKFAIGLLHEDLVFSPVALMAAERAGVLDAVLYIRRYRVDSIVTEAGRLADAKRLAHRTLATIRKEAEFSSRGWLGRYADMYAEQRSLDRTILVRLAHPRTAWRALFAAIPEKSAWEGVMCRTLIAKSAFRNIARRGLASIHGLVGGGT